jgi:L-ascorbate metabolism protein UlaG (beta-lactamase superfamily)
MTMLKRAEKVGRRFLNPVPATVGGLGMIFKVLPQFLLNREERVPRRALGPFRTDASVYAKAPESGLRITWMGHSSMLVEIDGVRVLLDPVWDERASPVQWAGPKRFFAPTLRLEELPPIDAVLVSHDHYDHLGAGTVRRLAALQPQARWVTPLGVGAILRRLGVRAERIAEMDWTETVTVAGAAGARCEITALPARHFSGRGAFNRFETLWASFVLRGAGHTVYYGADSGWWEGFAEIAIRRDDAGDWRIQRALAVDPHGAGWSGAGVSRAGWGGLADADPLGALQSGTARVASADGAPAGAGGG